MEKAIKSGILKIPKQSKALAVSRRPKGRLARFSSSSVGEWTKFFLARAGSSGVFESTAGYIGNTTRSIAVITGANWLNFSTWLPAFLALSTAKVSNNFIRHYMIQIVYEELGSDKSEGIHCDLFKSALTGADITDADLEPVNTAQHVKVLNGLYETLVKTDNDSEILGLNLGMEIIAEHNLETLFALLAYSEKAAASLNESLFFKVHRIVEEEHQRLSISNFLRFCGDETEKKLFMKGFDRSITFWSSFWKANHSTIVSSGKNQTAAL